MDQKTAWDQARCDTVSQEQSEGRVSVIGADSLRGGKAATGEAKIGQKRKNQVKVRVKMAEKQPRGDERLEGTKKA